MHNSAWQFRVSLLEFLSWELGKTQPLWELIDEAYRQCPDRELADNETLCTITLEIEGGIDSLEAEYLGATDAWADLENCRLVVHFYEESEDDEA